MVTKEWGSDEIESVYVEYFPRVYNYIYYKLLNRDEADDLVSRVFVRIVENIGCFDESKGTLDAWIFRIARNALIDEFRRKKPVVSIDGDELDMPSDCDVQLTFIQNEDRRVLYRELMTLTQRERTLVTMKYFAEMTNRGIAAELNMNESTVSTALWRAMQKLRKGLKDYIEGGV